MGLFSKIKKGFKKIFKGIKKVVKKVVKGVKKVVKKISSSKILKALAIAAGVIVTGGAALTAFGGTGALATSPFGTWMMSTSQSALGGSLIGGGSTAANIANTAIKTIAKPFGAVGGALGSAARVGANLFDPNQTLFQAGPARYDASGKLIFGDTQTLDTESYAPKPFSGSAFSGQTVTDTTNIVYDEKAGVYYDTKTKTELSKGTVLTESQVDRLPSSFRSGKDVTAQSGFRQVAGRVGETVAGSVLSGVAAQYIAGDPEPQGSMSGAAYEGGEYMDPLKVYAAQQGINTDDIYSHMMYGNQDPSTQYGNDLYRQQTFGVA